MQPREIINTVEFNLIIKRLAFELIENHTDFENTVLIGLQSKGVYLAKRLQEVLQEILGAFFQKERSLERGSRGWLGKT